MTQVRKKVAKSYLCRETRNDPTAQMLYERAELEAEHEMAWDLAMNDGGAALRRNEKRIEAWREKWGFKIYAAPNKQKTLGSFKRKTAKKVKKVTNRKVK
jgi:hypothetical protein